MESAKTPTPTKYHPNFPPNGPSKGKGIATQVFPRAYHLLPGEPVALDLEMQEYRNKGTSKWHHRAAWAGIVSASRVTILDCFVDHPFDGKLDVKNPKTPDGCNFGITWDRLKGHNGAVKVEDFEAWVKAILNGRPVILHDGRLDMNAFKTDVFSGATMIIDTQKLFSHMQPSGKPGLAKLALALLGEHIQVDSTGQEDHSPVEDADTTMRLALLSTPYDRTTEQAKFDALDAAARAVYFDTLPVMKPHHFQGNRIDDAPFDYPNPNYGRHRGVHAPKRGGGSRGYSADIGHGRIQVVAQYNSHAARGGQGGKGHYMKSTRPSIETATRTVFDLNNTDEFPALGK